MYKKILLSFLTSYFIVGCGSSPVNNTQNKKEDMSFNLPESSEYIENLNINSDSEIKEKVSNYLSSLGEYVSNLKIDKNGIDDYIIITFDRIKNDGTTETITKRINKTWDTDPIIIVNDNGSVIAVDREDGEINDQLIISKTPTGTTNEYTFNFKVEDSTGHIKEINKNFMDPNNQLFNTLSMGGESLSILNNDPFNDGSLIAKLLFDGDTNDSLGNYNIVNNEGNNFIDGKFNQSLYFDGGVMGKNTYNNGIHLPNDLVRDKDQFTISTWIKGSGIIIESDWYQDAGGNFATGWAIGTDFIAKATSRSSKYHYIFPDIDNNVWQYITVSFDHNGVFKYYVNGVLTHTGDISGTKFYDGRYYADTGTNIGAGYANEFIGEMDTFEIYNRILTESEVQTLYNRSIH